MTGPPARTWAEVSLPRLVRNLQAIRDLIGPGVSIAAVVKANAYGHGALPVSRRLAAAGVEQLAVSCVEEGVSLREAGIETRILLMGETLSFERDAVFRYGLTPVVHSLEGLREWNEAAESRRERLSCHCKLETGLNRLGIRASGGALAAAILSAPWLSVDGLMTHFASATDFTTTQTEEQIEEFIQLREELAWHSVRPGLLHLASTNGVAYGRRMGWETMVRPGHLLYGYVSPARGEAPAPTLEVQPVLEWKARVVDVRNVPAGARIGYGGLFCAPKPMRIAVLGVGYADGLPHALSNKGKVLLHGRACPIVGAVSMDMTTVDATALPGVGRGDAATLIGRDGKLRLGAQEVAKTARTISYNLLCGIGARVKRVYLD